MCFREGNGFVRCLNFPKIEALTTILRVAKAVLCQHAFRRFSLRIKILRGDTGSKCLSHLVKIMRRVGDTKGVGTYKLDNIYQM